MSSNDNRFRNRLNGVTASATVKYAGGAATPSGTFTRPANVTPYAPGDLVANHLVAAQVAPISIVAAREFATSFFVMRGRLSKSSVNVANASFLLHLYASAPAPVNGDNEPFQSNKAADYLGAIAFPAMRQFSDGAWASGMPVDDGPIVVELAAGRAVFGLLEVQGAYVPSNAEVFRVTLELQQD